MILSFVRGLLICWPFGAGELRVEGEGRTGTFVPDAFLERPGVKLKLYSLFLGMIRVVRSTVFWGAPRELADRRGGGSIGEVERSCVGGCRVRVMPGDLSPSSSLWVRSM